MNAVSTTSDQEEPAMPDWAAQTPDAIIAFILRRFHEPLRSDLPVFVSTARAVETAVKENPLCPAGLANHLEQILVEVECHLDKEEKILFPLILAGRGGSAFMPIKVMMAEHDDHLANLARTRVLTHGFAVPADASQVWRTLYLDLQRFDADLNQHIQLENNVLFTRVMSGQGDR